ncbi:hypothetical protein N8I74_00910 [Chitiniphilus purpureus]|uniref:Class I SAM-dependent methyltransferase n=1 Tax=Chitiniphilus purpureus TaxID=2981137 RepID=A0ABY6DML9_9NEIS|nr:hypothetical protein [Chitiniphilus sp. CD1]UXY15607.1 hypothetical protein N8I74_00910 [Chitiniphilus sp. CD1]
MNPLATQLIKSLPFYPWLKSWATTRRNQRELADWKSQGRPVPPPHIVKQQTIRQFAERYGLDILVETGTYRGDMIAAMRPWFKKIYSIELSPELHLQAQLRFSDDPAISLIQGDSADELGKLLDHLGGPALFWLDGHYSGGVTARGSADTPILGELTHLLNQTEHRHVVLIDDARCFGDDPAYPTQAELFTFIRSHRPDAVIDVVDDIIRLVQS